MSVLETTSPEVLFFVYQGFLSRDSDDSQDSRGREVTIFYYTLPLPPVHEYSDIFCNFAREMTITYF